MYREELPVIAKTSMMMMLSFHQCSENRSWVEYTSLLLLVLFVRTDMMAGFRPASDSVLPANAVVPLIAVGAIFSGVNGESEARPLPCLTTVVVKLLFTGFDREISGLLKIQRAGRAVPCAAKILDVGKAWSVRLTMAPRIYDKGKKRSACHRKKKHTICTSKR